jgi:plastocyanin
MKKIIAILAILMLFLTACGSETTEETETTDADTTATVKEFEVRMYEDKIDPTTMTVNEGDTVRLVFLNTNPKHFSLEKFDIEEDVTTGVIEFVASEKGAFEYRCSDCDQENLYGVLKVR